MRVCVFVEIFKIFLHLCWQATGFCVLQQGQLSHPTMTKEILKVKVYGDIVLVTGCGKDNL